MSRFDRTDDRGQIGGVEVLPFGVLIFVVGSLLIANAWAVIDAKMATTSAAREATRVFVEAPGDLSVGQIEAAAIAAGREAIDAHGRDGAAAVIDIDGAFERCAPVTVEVTYEIPAISLPFGGGFGSGFDVRGRHSEIVDPFRSGVPGEGGCD
ncbi:hypothetical protein BH20ACT2_BH20ACT2_24980 [soil metagenome]